MHATEIAERLVRDHAEGVRFAPFAAAAGIATLDAAYDVQRHLVERLRRERGAAVAGYKIGLTSPGMQAMCGIDTPVAGVLLADRWHANGSTLARACYGRLGIEFEIAVRMGHDLVGSETTIDDVAAAVAAVAPAIEVVDDRHCDYRTLDVLSLVADNAWNAGFVLGDFRDAWPDLSSVIGAVHVDDAAEPLGRGGGRDVLGHPFAAVAWLAGHLAAQGNALRAGDIVMTGSMVTTKFPTVAGRWRFEIGGLGGVWVDVV